MLRGFTLRDNEIAIRYSAAARTNFAGGEITPTTPPQIVADLIHTQLNHVRAGLPKLFAHSSDPGYAAWFAGLMHLVEQQRLPPVSYGDYFDERLGWQIGWKDGGTRYPAPLAPP